jgi:micrococcal nuclease
MGVRVSKHWNPGKTPVALKPSRIRRDPVRIVSDIPSVRRVARRSDERETWFGIAGVMLFAAVIVAAIVAVSWATLFRDDPAAAAEDARFGQCYNGGSNCVIDGDTIQVHGQKLTIAGIDAPRIRDASCDAERSHGIDAAVLLAELLNRGRVTVGPTYINEFGRAVRTVQVKGKDVGKAMVDAGVARKYRAERKGWC